MLPLGPLHMWWTVLHTTLGDFLVRTDSGGCNDEQGLEALMENVTSVAFTSCTLRHNAKLPDLELPGGPVAARPAVQPHQQAPSRGEAGLNVTLILT